MPPVVCPNCEAFVTSASCVICGWRRPREETSRIPAEPPRPVVTPEEAARVHDITSTLVKRFSLEPSQEIGDCPTCWRVGCLRHSRVNEHECYYVCLSCGTKTAKNYREPSDALRAWKAGEVKVSPLPWSILPALDPRVQAHAAVFEGKGMEGVAAIRRAQDLLTERYHEEMCTVCRATAAASGSSPPIPPE